MFYIVFITTDIRGESKKFGEWYQKTNKAEDTNKLTLRLPNLFLNFSTTYMKNVNNT
jgi:hypothetical protein